MPGRKPFEFDVFISYSSQDKDWVRGELLPRGFVHHDLREGRFDLHPIVRRYAYDRPAAPERAAAHTVRARQLDEARTRFHNRLHDALYYPLGASSSQ